MLAGLKQTSPTSTDDTRAGYKSEETKGLKRTFPLYIKFPESEFSLIKKAEKFDEEGNKVFAELSKVYREKYELRKGQPRSSVSLV